MAHFDDRFFESHVSSLHGYNNLTFSGFSFLMSNMRKSIKNKYGKSAYVVFTQNRRNVHSLLYYFLFINNNINCKPNMIKIEAPHILKICCILQFLPFCDDVII
jgi:hypothetical protein